MCTGNVHDLHFTIVVVAPTCEEEGSTTYTCEDCGKTFTTTQSALGHSYSKWTNDGASSHQSVCSRCSESATVACTELEYVVTTANGDVTFFSCPVCKTATNGATVERVEASAKAVTGKLPKGSLIVRVTTLSSGEKVMTVAFARNGKLVKHSGKVQVTLPKTLLNGCTLQLVHADGTVEDVEVTADGDEVTFTVDFDSVTNVVLNMAEA